MFNINHEEKELPSINMSMKLQGYMLGYDVLQCGVIVQSHRYAQPVKNMVVNSGKNAFFTSGGGNATYPSGAYLHNAGCRFGYNSIFSGSASGSLAFCGRGSSSTAAAATDTALGAQIGNLTSTFLVGDPNTGTRFDRENGKVVMRVTHEHEAEIADCNINELGWFGKQTGSPYMFSRIVLPSTITVLTGQALRTIYQLEVTITPIVATSCAPSITGWTSDGNYRWECGMPATSSTFTSPTFNNFPLFDVIGTNGENASGSFDGTYEDSAGLLPISSIWHATMYGSAQTFNSFGTAIPGVSATSSIYHAGSSGAASSGTATNTVQNYTAGNFYRDRVMVFEPNWTGNSSISIYAIRLNGLMYIFDNPQTKTNTQRLTLTYRISVS